MNIQIAYATKRISQMFQVGAQSFPVSPIVVNTQTLSTTNPNGVVHVDATQAQAGETSTITVMATDPTTNTSTSQSFMVTVAPNSTTYPITLQPVAFNGTPVNHRVNGTSLVV